MTGPAAIGPLLATAGGACVPPVAFATIAALFLLVAVWLLYGYIRCYYAVLRKIAPRPDGGSVFLTSLLRPFLIYSKEARAQPEYWRMWRYIALFFMTFVIMVVVMFAVHWLGCSAA